MTHRLLLRFGASAAFMTVPLLAQAPVGRSAERAQPRWFSAWAAAHNVGLGVEGLSGGSVRLIVRPTLSGESLRVKLSNIRGNAPAEFSAAYVGVSGGRRVGGHRNEPPADV